MINGSLIKNYIHKCISIKYKYKIIYYYVVCEFYTVLYIQIFIFICSGEISYNLEGGHYDHTYLRFFYFVVFFLI